MSTSRFPSSDELIVRVADKPDVVSGVVEVISQFQRKDTTARASSLLFDQMGMVRADLPALRTALNTKFNITLTTSEVENFLTVRDVVNNVERRIFTSPAGQSVIAGGGKVAVPASSYPGLAISNLPGAIVFGQPYNFLPAITGGRKPYAVDTLGVTPRGLYLLPTGYINGTPLASNSDFVIRVTDASGAKLYAKPGDTSWSATQPSFGGTVTPPTPTPTLTLSGSFTYAASDAAGVTVFTIANVPTGVTPILATPSDGRMIIAGNQVNGWKVVKGMNASTAGTISVSVTAAGATGANGNVTVTAGTVTPSTKFFGSTSPSWGSTALHFGDN